MYHVNVINIKLLKMIPMIRGFQHKSLSYYYSTIPLYRMYEYNENKIQKTFMMIGVSR